MARRTSVIKVSVEGDAKGLKKGMKDAEASLSPFKAAVGATAGFIAAQIGFNALNAVKDFVAGSISAASDLNESLNAVQVAYGDHAAAIVAIGETSAEQFGLSQRAVNEAATSLSAFVEKINESDPPEAFKNIIGRATDFASVFNLDVEDALAKFRSGLAGESEPLRKFGLDLSAASVAAYAVEEGISASASAMTESEKIQARYGLLMKQTNKVQGDFANTSDSLANSQRILSAEWEDMQSRVGQKLVPVMEDILALGRDLLPTFEYLALEVAELAGVAQDAVGALGLLSDVLKTIKGEEGADFASSFESLKDFALWATDKQSFGLQGFVFEFLGLKDAAEETAKALEDGAYAERDNARHRKTGAGAARDRAAAEVEVHDAIARTVKVQEELTTRQRQAIDPVFNLVTETRNQAQAQAEVNRLQEEGLTDTDEYSQSVMDLVTANLDLSEAQKRYAQEGGAASIGVLENLLSAAGLTTAEIRNLIDTWNLAEFEDHRLKITVPSFDPSTGRWSTQKLHTGGTFHAPPGQTEGLAMLRDGEEVTTPEAAAAGRNRAGAVPAVVHNHYMTIHALDPHAAANAVVEALQEYNVMNGPAPVLVAD